MKLEDLQIVILAGGLATRLGTIAKTRPKSMVLIKNRPFLEHQIRSLKAKGIHNIVLCTGHLGEQISDYFGNGEKFGVKIAYSLEKTPLGTAGALKNAEDLLSDTFMTIYGDSYLSLDFDRILKFFESYDRLALMTVYRNFDRYDKSNTAIDGIMVKKYSKTDKREPMDYIDYGANIFRKEVLGLVPSGRFYSLEELFTRLVGSGQMLAYEVKERFYEIGSPSGLAEFEKYLEDNRL